MNNIALVTTFFDYPEYTMPCFMNNAKKYFKEEDIHIIRYFTENVTLNSLYEKLYIYKIVKNIEYYKKYLLGKYKYMIFADAKDTNFYRPPTDIIQVFEEFNCNIVFCGERGFWPPINEKYLYDTKEKNTDSFYLNSGLYIGYTDKIIEHMEIIIRQNRTVYDDQGHWTLEYLLNNDIKVDQESKIFFSTFETKNLITVSEDGTYVISSAPYMVHDNGPFGDTTLKIAHLI
jgi:hypothetical protein